MEYKVNLKGHIVTLVHDDLDASINVDDLTIIDTSQIYGEAVTITPAVNRIGLLKAEVGAVMAEAKLEYKLYEGNFIAQKRKQAASNGGFYLIRVDNEDVKVKATQGALDTCFETDPGWLEKKRAFIQAEKNFNALDSLYWACQDKSRKLNSFISQTTPEDFIAGVVEKKINGVQIKKID